MLRHSLHFPRFPFRDQECKAQGVYQELSPHCSHDSSLQCPAMDSRKRPVPCSLSRVRFPRRCEPAPYVSRATAKISVCMQMHTVSCLHHTLFSLGLLSMICYHFDLLKICLPDQRVLAAVCSAHRGVGPRRARLGSILYDFS